MVQRNSLRARTKFGLLVFLLVLSGCTPRWIVAPNDPSLEADRAPFSGLELVLTSFSVSQTTKSDNINDLGFMRNRFIDYLRARNDFQSISDYTGRVGLLKGQSFITMDVQAVPSQTKWRTYILDIPFFYPMCGYWPLTPLWGTVGVDVTAVIKDSQGGMIKTIRASAKEGYSVIFYSWYRTSVVEEAFKKAYGKAFSKISSAVALDQVVIADAALSASTAPVAAPVAALSSHAEEPVHSITIALIDLQGKNVDPTEASIISDVLRERFLKTKRVVLVERNEMDEVLKEQGFQQTGCTETSCAVEIGRLLNVEYIAMGNVSRLGKTYVVSVRMVDLQSGSIKVAESVNHTGAIDGLPGAMAELARRLIIQLK